MPNALKARTLGLPRWAWIAILAGGLTIGLIIRNRMSQSDSTATDGTDASGSDQTYPDAPQDYGDGSGDYGAGAYDTSWDSGLTLSPAAQGGYFQWPTIPSAQEPSSITVNNYGSTPTNNCKDKPTKAAPNGYHWVCLSGKWALRPNQHATSGGGGGNACDPKKKGVAKHGFHKVCKNGKWVTVPNNNNPDPNKRDAVTTGGGPPDRPAAHHPNPPRVPRNRRRNRAGLHT